MKKQIRKKLKLIKKNTQIISSILLLIIILPISTYANQNTITKNTNNIRNENENSCYSCKIEIENGKTQKNNFNLNKNNLSNKINNNDKNNNNYTLEDAEIEVLMNIRGILIKTHTITDFKNNPVYIITIKEENKLKTFIVEKDQKPKLIDIEN